MDDGSVFGAPSLEQRLELGRDNVKVVLVVGERPEQASALAERLGLLGVDAIACARDTRLALRSIIAHDVSLILLDVDDSQDSARLIGTLNDVCDAPVIARGVMTDTDHVVAYLESGAADFVSRTTTLPVLAAKIQSLLRSVHSNGSAAALIEVGEVSIDLRSRSVTRGNEEISLTPLEYSLLSELAANKGRPCKRKDLLISVWGEDFTSCSHYLRLYVGYLRQKLEDDPRRPRMLLTEWGYGYKLVEPKGAPLKQARGSLRLASQG
jgi:two-component system KDP operon response regulator KdpE